MNLSTMGNLKDTGYINHNPGTSATPAKEATGYGYNGVEGWKPRVGEWTGFETTTVGPASNVLDRLNAQNGLQSTDPMVMAMREPFRVGRFMVKWTKAPAFFPEIAVKWLRFIFEDMVMEVSGVPENSIDKIDIQNGAVHATTSYPGIYHESGNSVTLKVRESAGSPVRKFLDYWISGVSDRKTGVCHMYGAKMRAVLPNMAGSILYVLLGPTCRPEDIEFACMWHEIMPYQEKASHLNSGNIGDAGSGVDMDVEFSGMYDRGPEIDIYARKIVEGYNLYGQNYLNQLLPSYMYDNDMFGDTDLMKQLSIDMNMRVENRDSSNSEPIYDDDKIATRKNYFRNFVGFNQPTKSTNLGEAGGLTGGISDNIVGSTEGVVPVGSTPTTITSAE